MQVLRIFVVLEFLVSEDAAPGTEAAGDLALEATKIGHLEDVGFSEVDAVDESVDAFHDLWGPECLIYHYSQYGTSRK